MPPEEDRATAIDNMHKKFGEDRTSSSEDVMIADRQTHTTDRHSHHDTPLPYWGRSKTVPNKHFHYHDIEKG